jgi:hypothetical protein
MTWYRPMLLPSVAAYWIYLSSSSLLIVWVADGFGPQALKPVLSPRGQYICQRSPRIAAQKQEKETSGYEDSDKASKGLVASLTKIVNSFGRSPPSETSPSFRYNSNDKDSPRSPEELMERIRQDYTVKNYLWTGDIDLSAFDNQCRFTDPTLSFTGTDQFVKNLQNLRPIVDALVRPGGCSSILLDIQLNDKEGYIRSRWNMLGDLDALPWKPRIDVIGITKFWYKGDSDCYRVVLYDEEWEIPAGKALLQLVTPAGTIANSKLR